MRIGVIKEISNIMRLISSRGVMRTLSLKISIPRHFALCHTSIGHISKNKELFVAQKQNHGINIWDHFFGRLA